jgi:hypothetical protein
LNFRWRKDSSELRFGSDDFGVCRWSCCLGRIRVCRRAGCAVGGRFSQHPHEKPLSFAAAVSGHCGKLFATPLHHDPRPDCDGRLDPKTGSRTRRVFQSGRSARFSSGRVFPRDLGRLPDHGSGFDVAPVHAMCIGVGVTEFSYQWVGCALPPSGATTRFNLAAVHDRNRTPSQNGSGPERRPAERCSACPALRPGPRSEQAHESAGGEIGGKEVRVFQSGSAGQGFGGEVSAADGAFHGCGPAAGGPVAGEENARP